MPKIAASTVAEHHEAQSAAIIEAAGTLFANQGVSATDMGEIAAAVGLSRTALYRYFPDRDHIFVAWADRMLNHVLGELEELLRGEEDPTRRLDIWIAYMLEHASGADHAVGRRVEAELGSVPFELREKVAEAHEAVQLRILDTVVELVGSERDAVVLARMAGAAVQAASSSLGDADEVVNVKPQVIVAVHRLLDLDI